MKRRVLLAVALIAAVVAIFFLLNRCSSDNVKQESTLSDLSVIHEHEFGGVYLGIPIDEFNECGFEYGDSVRIEFSNGYSLEDIPYYSGYYTVPGDPLLVAYPGYAYIKAVINSGDDLWELFELQDEYTATVTLLERGKYLSVQEACDLHYVDDHAQYPSDEAFANFRNVTAGEIREGRLYRSASPCDNQHNRAPYVDALISEAEINSILNLADNNEKIQGYILSDDFDSPYFLELYESSTVIPIALSMSYGSEEFKTKLVDGLERMTLDEGPFLVHCTEGKDRTGFVCMLIEALCGATYDEIVDDYMITYENYYGITKERDPEKYDIIVSNNLDPMIRSMIGDESADPSIANLAVAAETYLRGAGMTEDQISTLRLMLTD